MRVRVGPRLEREERRCKHPGRRLGLPALYWFGMSGTIPRVLMIGGFLTAAGTFIHLHAIGIRCPRCTNRLERYYHIAFFCFRGPESCPYCGLDFDRPAY